MSKYLTLVVAVLLFTVISGNVQAAPDMPVKVKFRESLLIPGTFVIQFRNDGDSLLVLHAEIDRADGSARKTFTLPVPGNGMKEVGHNQGWNGKSGDLITVHCEGFTDVTGSIP